MTPFRLGPFEVLEKLGQGGMGDVYRARQEPFGRIVALKLMRAAGQTTSDSARRFTREIEIAAGLSHPHLVKVLDGGTVDETSFIAMELVEGDTLAKVMEATPVLPWTHAAAIGSRLADGLAYLHARNILHRDVKPGNALLGLDGWVKLMDFGLARPQEATMMTADGAVVGTLQFMAPEVVKGGRATAAADLWAVGCILYRMLTGRIHVPADGQADFVQKLLAAPIVPPIDLNPEMPRALSDTVMTLLVRDPARRPADAQAVAGALDDHLMEFAGNTWDQVLTPTQALALLGRQGRPAPAPTPRGSEARARTSGETPSPGRISASTPRTGLPAARSGPLPITGPVAAAGPGRRSSVALGVIAALALASWGALRRPAPPPPVPSATGAPASSAAPVAAPSPRNADFALSYTRSIRELARFLPRLRAGGKAATRALEEMRPLAHVWIGDTACAWVYCFAVEEWLADPRRPKDPPFSSCGQHGPMEILDEKMFVKILLRSKLRRPEPGITAATLEQLAMFPDDGRVWLTLGRIFEVEGRAAEAALAYGVALERIAPRSLNQNTEFLWFALARALIVAPGKNLERDWWGFMEVGKEGRRGLRGLGEALDLERGGFARFEAMLRGGVKLPRFRNEVADVLAEVLDEEKLLPERAREEMYAFLATKPDDLEVVSDRLMRHLMARGRIAEARKLAAALSSPRPWDAFSLEYLSGDPRVAPAAPEAPGAQVRERQAPLEAFRLMEIGNWAEAAREASTLDRYNEDARERMKLIALDLLGRPDPAPWVTETVTEALVKLRNPALLREATGALSTPLGRPWMQRTLASLGLVESSVPFARAVWLSRCEKLTEAFDALAGLKPGKARDGGRFPIDVLEIAARPLWLSAAGLAVDPTELERARSSPKLPTERARLKSLIRHLSNGDREGALREAWKLQDQTPAADYAFLSAAWLQGAWGEPGEWPERRAQLLASLRFRGHGVWLLDELRRIDALVRGRVRSPSARGTARPDAGQRGP